METGLTNEAVILSRQQYGSNKIDIKNENSFIKLLIESLGDPIIRILLIVLAVKTVFLFREFDWFETLGILIAIFLASFISSISEYGSGKAFNKLFEKNARILVRVKRNNILVNLPIDELVVNDIVLLASGEAVPADGIIIKGNITVDESSLTGVSYEVHKSANGSKENNKLYKGSVVYSDECIMKVTAVGLNTMYGSVLKELTEVNPDSPLKSRLRHLAQIISRIGYCGAFLVFVSYLFSVIVISNNFNPVMIIETITNLKLMVDYIIYALTLSVTIIIVSVPEGLPMMVALVLSTNMKKMLKNNVLVRKLVGIETAGSINLLLTDKTGTLTKGALTVVGICNCEGIKYTDEVELLKYPNYLKILSAAININNSSELVEGKIIGGNTTDQALKKFLPNYEPEVIIKIDSFDSNTKLSKVETKNNIYIKGASEVILPKCKYYLDNNGKKTILRDQNKILTTINSYTRKGIRIIALAYNDNQTSEDFIYLGIALIQDEIRKEAKEGLAEINAAGIHLIMITGDAYDTALAVARELDMINIDSITMTSEEFNKLTVEEIKNILPKIKIIARAKPTDKSKLVRIAQEMNLVVGMTGDGVNDAAALKKSDVGFAMGSGTEVAKEASDIVIIDNNIKSISHAILYGRTIFKNIRKFIIFQLTLNICALTLSIIGPFIGIRTPITVLQMLWINMIMDTLAGLAFAYETAKPEYMDEKPKPKNEPIINRYMYGELIITGIYSAILCLFFLRLPIFRELIRDGVDHRYFMTAFFTLFVFIGIFNAFNARTKDINVFRGITKNKVFLLIFSMVVIIQLYLIYHGGGIFRTYGLTLFELGLVLSLAFTVIPVDMLRKLYLKKKNNKDYL